MFSKLLEFYDAQKEKEEEKEKKENLFYPFLFLHQFYSHPFISLCHFLPSHYIEITFIELNLSKGRRKKAKKE